MPLRTNLVDAYSQQAGVGETILAPGSPFARIAVGNLFDLDVSGYATATIYYLGTYSGHAMTLEKSLDGTDWVTATAFPNTASSAGNAGAINNSGQMVEVPLEGAMRLRASITVAPTVGQMVAIVTLSTSARVVRVQGQGQHNEALRGSPVRLGARALSASYTTATTGRTADLISTLDGRLIVLPGAIPENTWSYAAASGGITNTTAVTIKAAGASGIRNYLRSLNVVNASATASEISIRDGAAGTVLWRGYVPASMTAASQISFDPPLRGTAATLMEVVCATTATQTYVNAQGWTAP
jgi:hypothetical protein